MVIVAAALVGAYFSAVFARAAFLFQQDTAESIPAAVDLVPYNAGYVARLGAWQPDHKEALLQRAVQLNRFDYESWIQLGLTAEMQQHDLSSAEKYYLQAAKVNQMFQPKWTLTNFYFRNEQPDKFFHWAKATLQISPYQADPVFTQMWLLSQDAARIAAAIPDRPGVLLEYTNFLTRSGQFAPIPAVVERLAQITGDGHPSEPGRDEGVLQAEDRILAAGQLRPAMAVWRSIAQAGWIHAGVPTPASPLSNGNFATTFLNHGFDWTPAASAGLTVEQSPGEKRIEITLSGDEPEHCLLLQQYIPLDPGRAYHLAWHAEGHSLEVPTGISWQVHPVESGTAVQLRAGDVLEGADASWDFRAPSSDVGLLTLEYDRPLGKVRANGSVTLRSVFLQEK